MLLHGGHLELGNGGLGIEVPQITMGILPGQAQIQPFGQLAVRQGPPVRLPQTGQAGQPLLHACLLFQGMQSHFIDRDPEDRHRSGRVICQQIRRPAAPGIECRQEQVQIGA